MTTADAVVLEYGVHYLDACGVLHWRESASKAEMIGV